MDVNAPTEATNNVQTAAFSSISSYPQSNIQRVKCHVSDRLLHVLYHAPELITRAVDCFYQREQGDMKAAAMMRVFNGPKSLSTVKFTQMTFAMLLGQRFNAPRCIDMPLADDPDYSSHDIGMKLVRLLITL